MMHPAALDEAIHAWRDHSLLPVGSSKRGQGGHRLPLLNHSILIGCPLRGSGNFNRKTALGLANGIHGDRLEKGLKITMAVRRNLDPEDPDKNTHHTLLLNCTSERADRLLFCPHMTESPKRPSIKLRMDPKRSCHPSVPLDQAITACLDLKASVWNMTIT